jgi:energy-coupling factor transporter ATP-binding protein EcfA2
MSELMRSAVNYLYEWAKEQGNWAILLANNVVSEIPVIDDLRDEIIKVLVNDQENTYSIGSSVINSGTKYEHIRLNKLGKITGVNKLSQGQEITFHDKLTIIYGDNGSGKTGYYRILKSIGSSVEKNSPPQILNNIFGKPEQQSATIDYVIDGKNQSLHWANNNETIPGVVVFDSNCASVSIDSNRKTILKPIGFNFFNIISQELVLISNRIDKKINEISLQLLKKEFIGDTTSKKFFEGLTWSDENDKIDNFDYEGIKSLKEVEEKLIQLEQTAKELNPELINRQIKNYGVVKSECDRYQEMIEKLKLDFSKEKISQYFTALDDNKKATEIIPEFNDFLKAAKKFVDNHFTSTYPTQGDECIYCGQLLTGDSIEHIHNFKSMLQSGSAKKFEQNKIKIENFEKSVTMLQTPLYKKEIFELVENFGDIAGLNNTLSNYISNFKVIVQDKTCSDDECKKILEFNYDALLTQCKEFNDKIDMEVESKKKKLGQIQELITQNQSLSAELTDYKWIVENREKIRIHLSILKSIHTYEAKKTDLYTRKLSAKMKSAEKEFITDTYKTTLLEEFKKLRCPDNISVDVSISKSEPSVKQNIQKNDLEEVLSEGEQKVVSLAEFITEALIDNQIQVLIFDDPVNSLDVGRSDEIAMRLCELSKEKQVIVFTHNIVFFSSLQQTLDKNCQYYYYVNSNLTATGILSFNIAPTDENWDTYSKTIDNIIKNAGTHGLSVEDDVLKGYGYIRSAMEFIYEQVFLSKSIQRYRRNISPTIIPRIKWVEFDKLKEEYVSLYGRASGAILGHTNPEGVVRPDIQQLQKDFDRLKEIRNILKV